MTEQTDFNFENYGNEQTGFFGSTEGDAQFINQNESPIDLTAYNQGDNAILQQSAGYGNITEQNTFNPDNIDTNAIFGQTLQTETTVPENFGQTYQESNDTNTANVIEGNNYFETTNQTQDTNAFISNTNDYNFDTNAIFSQGQTTEVPFGEAQTVTDTNTFFQTNQDYGQLQPEEGQNIYSAYQATKTNDVNSLGYGTTETQKAIEPQTQIFQNPGQPQPYFPPLDVPITQEQTTTTTTRTEYNQIPEPVFPNENNNQLNFEAYPASQTQVHKNEPPQPQFNITNFQQTLDATPITTSQNYIQAEPQFSPQVQQKVVIQNPVPQKVIRKVVKKPQPIIQGVYTPPPQPVPIANPIPRPVAQPQIRYVTGTAQRPVQYIQTNNIVTPTPAPVVPQQEIINYQTQTASPVVQTGIIPGYQYINKVIDEDLRRGRPVYNEPGVPSNKLKHLRNNQLGQINQVPTTYKVGNIVGLNRNKIGLSKLASGNSYNRAPINTPSLNNIVPTINTPNINTNLGNVVNPSLNKIVPSINTPSLNTNIGNNINNAVGNVNNAIGNINTGLNKLGKAESYNVGAQSITPLLNNVGLNPNNVIKDNTRLPQLKDFL